MSPLARVKLRISRWYGVGGDPQNGMKRRHRIEAAIETKNVLVEVGLQMLWLDTAMMRPLDPSFQVAENEMDHGQVRFGLVGVAAKRQHVVAESVCGKSRIASPSVSSHDGADRNILFDKATEGLRAPVGHDAKPQPPRIDAARVFLAVIRSRPNLNSADNDRFVMHSATFAARLAANQAFVNFDRMLAADGVTLRANHTGAQFVENLKRRFIARERKLALELDCGLSGDLCSHEVRAPEPSRKRRVARLHDRASRQRRVGLATTATQHDRRARCEPIRLSRNAALLTRKPIRPTDGFQIAGASRVVGEYPFKLRKRSGETANVHA